MHVYGFITDLYRDILLHKFPLISFEHADFVEKTTSETILLIFS
jgi:hypothetical protein